ncbi:glutathione S-transferase [Xylariaceae sp. FL0255]|nr:glutathione S-transferase [Xylariaceae sp. FL0255]
MSLKPIKIYGVFGPNASRVIMILQELGLAWEDLGVTITDVKKTRYLAVNPNGRLPAIYDPNTDLTLWESGAIIEYLVETYDKNNKISFPKGSNEAYMCKQWLYFQVSGQGPYYGQAVWFTKYHPEKVPSAVERYVKEINRVTGVLEIALSAAKKRGSDDPYLVGDKLTFADIAFYSWQWTIVFALGNDVIDYAAAPTVKAWFEMIGERASIKKAMEVAKNTRE